MDILVEKILPKAYLVQICTEEECNIIVQSLKESSLWQTAGVSKKTGDEIDKKIRNQQNIQYINFTDSFKFFADKSNSLIKSQINLFEPKTDLRIEICQFQKTPEKGYFRWHNDQMPDCSRMAISILYLTDARDGLLGGSTDLEVDNKVTSVYARKGWSLIFEPSVRHRGAEVFGGNKISLLTVFSV